MRTKKLIGILSCCILAFAATGFASLAEEADNSKIRVYDNAAVQSSSDEHVLLDTWTVIIFPDGSFDETDGGLSPLPLAGSEDTVAVEFKYYCDGINSKNEPKYTVEMPAAGEVLIKKTKLQTKAQGVSS